MTRQMTVVERFERGALVEVVPNPEYDEGTAHAYYVPDKARKLTGMVQVDETDSTEQFAHDDGSGKDWDAIRDLVSPEDLVERAEASILNRREGDVGDPKFRGRVGPFKRPSRSDDDKPTVPQGVVKFRDPDDIGEDTSLRDPVERGHYWGTVTDRTVTDSSSWRPQYHDDVQRTRAHQARVPMTVVNAGAKAIAAYLAAHDHSDSWIGHALDLERDEVEELLDGIANTD